MIPAAVPSPPLSPITTVQNATPLSGVEDLSLKEWQPYYLTTLEALPADVSARIPAQRNMATFTFDMLQNLFGGVSWSPGLRYINTTGACLLQNRTYYMLDPTNEPYLPKAPGKHGAKLSAFFNKAPEEEFDNLPEGTNSYTDVPLFVQVSPGRYAYYGNYSQTRWSDKLDHDTMKARVPRHVKDYMASELTAKLRDDWVTQELKKHFFPKPEYDGPLSVPTSDSTTINSIDEEKHQQQLTKDIKEYVQELTEWEREASMKIAMIKPDFILNAFDAVSCRNPRHWNDIMLTCARLMRMIRLLYASGGSTSNVSTGSWTSTTCSLVSRLALTIPSKRLTTTASMGSELQLFSQATITKPYRLVSILKFLRRLNVLR